MISDALWLGSGIEGKQEGVKEAEAGHKDASGASTAQGFAPDGLDFHWTALEEINEG